MLLESAEERRRKMIVAVNNATNKLFKFKAGRYNLKEQAAWKSRTAFVEDTLQEILRKAANREAAVYAKCCYFVVLLVVHVGGAGGCCCFALPAG